MKKLTLLLAAAGFISVQAQTVTTIEMNGSKYEVCDMTGKDKITWGVYSQIGASASDNSNGAKNTIAIVSAVGENKDRDGKPYAAKQCNNLEIADKNDWYLPSLTEMQSIYGNNQLVKLPEGNTYWTSTEASGTQAQTIYFYNGTTYQVAKVDQAHYVCLRKLN